MSILILIKLYNILWIFLLLRLKIRIYRISKPAAENKENRRKTALLCQKKVTNALKMQYQKRKKHIQYMYINKNKIFF